MPCAVIILVFVKFELVRFLLDGVVCKVHKEVIDVFGVLARSLVFLGGESSQTLLVDIDTQGIHSVDESVDPQVELQTIYQVRIVKVFLSHILIALLQFHVFEATDQENTPPLAEVDRLHDENFVAVFLGLCGELVFEVGHLRRQNPSLREYVIVILE